MSESEQGDKKLNKMTEKRLSVGINVSILIILTIFGVLLSLPLRLLLNTNYYTRNQSDNGNDTAEKSENTTNADIIVIPLDYRKLKLCPKLQYEDRLKSVFRSDYDRNCTYKMYVTDDDDDADDDTEEDGTPDTEGNEETRASKEIVGEVLMECSEESMKDPRMKSIPVAGYILVTMLVVSMIAALIEVLRIRFAGYKDSSRTGDTNSRKGSTIDLAIHRRFISRQPMKSQRSFEMQGMHRSALRLLGARPPPLIRRSSFPTQQAKQNTPSVGGTPNNRLSRRQSAESDEEIGTLINALHRRTRLIRRH